MTDMNIAKKALKDKSGYKTLSCLSQACDPRSADRHRYSAWSRTNRPSKRGVLIRSCRLNFTPTRCSMNKHYVSTTRWLFANY